jgi:hypothetical protein
MLFSGVLVGYLILPALIANKLGFDDLLSQTQTTSTVQHKELYRPTFEGNVERGISATTTVRGYGDEQIPKSVPIRSIRTEDVKETAEKRIVENESLYASQSMPTATTPHIMEISKLPDAKRKKIMVTGGKQ